VTVENDEEIEKIAAVLDRGDRRLGGERSASPIRSADQLPGRSIVPFMPAS